jgi:hypothetical protein
VTAGRPDDVRPWASPASSRRPSRRQRRQGGDETFAMVANCSKRRVVLQTIGAKAMPAGDLETGTSLRQSRWPSRRWRLLRGVALTPSAAHQRKPWAGSSRQPRGHFCGRCRRQAAHGSEDFPPRSLGVPSEPIARIADAEHRCRFVSRRESRLQGATSYSTTIETRRFSARPIGLSVPSGFVFAATGYCSPNPFTEMLAALTLPLLTSQSFTA